MHALACQPTDAGGAADIAAPPPRPFLLIWQCVAVATAHTVTGWLSLLSLLLAVRMVHGSSLLLCTLMDFHLHPATRRSSSCSGSRSSSFAAVYCCLLQQHGQPAWHRHAQVVVLVCLLTPRPALDAANVKGLPWMGSMSSYSFLVTIVF